MSLADVEHLLPDAVKTIIGLIGLPSTVRLVEALGGTTFPVAMRKTRLGEVRYEMLAAIVGAQAADRLTACFGGSPLYIPNCTQALRELTHRKIRADFDALTQHTSAIQAATQLAREYRMSDRHVWRILKRSDNCEQSAVQSDLF
ncbi:Mor transcription activator family protein [Caballeronia sp. LZ001]|uniref:Mor transcription activator family protein n=1 Tax=Caballeronia sp. LZ001 TaxID=3038553 RepID=UPI00286479D1|nr:Mor transcription activator family protein [Caballeronia sp. LZ001]MDR5803422.1 Mor transcription activator family protein [Caballeronia sp. LZ001]